MAQFPSNEARSGGDKPAPGPVQADRTCGRCGEPAKSSLARYCSHCGLRFAPLASPPVRRQTWYHVSWLLPLAIVTQEWERALGRWALNKRAGIVPFTSVPEGVGLAAWGLEQDSGITQSDPLARPV